MSNQHPPQPWLSMDTAPRDGTDVRLLIQDGEHPLQDDNPSVSLGAFKAADDDGWRPGKPRPEGSWDFAGWCWHTDRYCRGTGTPIGWLPLVDRAPSNDATKESA